MNFRPSLLFYCQHAMGMGHLVRSLALAESLASSFHVVLLNGGELPPGARLPHDVEIVNLPPLRLNHGQLVSRDSHYTLEQAKCARIGIILDSFHAHKPDILLTELFPFGRKKFEFELLPLLDEARRSAVSPLIACSLRDILISKRSDQKKYEEHALGIANRYFDHVLVHSDPSFARFEESFESDTKLIPNIHHTGFVVCQRSRQQTSSLRTGPVLVSAGGGLYGNDLLTTVIDAHELLPQSLKVSIKLIAGPFVPRDKWDALSDAVRDREGIELVRSVPDLYAELCNARASVSQCGYNTALEILQARVPALVVPFADAGEDEQMQRAMRLERRGLIRLLEQKETSAAKMAHELKGLLNYCPDDVVMDFDGARHSAELLRELLYRRRKEIAERTSERLEWQV